MVAPCTGDRIGQVQDHEVAFSFPYSMIDEVVQGLEATHKAGASRYPVTNWLNYTGGFPPSYDNYRTMLDQVGLPTRDRPRSAESIEFQLPPQGCRRGMPPPRAVSPFWLPAGALRAGERNLMATLGISVRYYNYVPDHSV